MRILIYILTLFWLTLSVSGHAQSTCAGAITVVNGYSDDFVLTGGSCNTPFTSASTCTFSASYFTDGDIYIYEITVPAGEELDVTLYVYEDWTAVGIYSVCTGSTLSGCMDEDANTSGTSDLNVSATNSSASDVTWYIVVGRWGNPCELDFDINVSVSGAVCLDPDALEDNCVDATLIDLAQAFEGTTDCAYTIDEPNSPYDTPNNWCGTIENNSWLTFIAAETDVELTWEVFPGLACSDGVQFSVWSGSCGSLSLISGTCLNPIDPGPSGDVGETGTWSLSALTIGETYYIMIDGFSGDLCDYAITPGDGVAVNPPNDSCINSIILSCGDTARSNTILATSNDAPPVCATGSSGKGAWYLITGAGNDIMLSTDNSATNFDTQINVYTAPDCSGPFTCVGGNDDGGSGNTSAYTFNSLAGIDYYIYIDGDGNDAGTFELTVSCTTTCDASNSMTWD